MRHLDRADLASLGPAADVPFTLSAGGRCWECLALLRVLPGRRLVLRARPAGGADGRQVVLKLFFGPGHRRYFRRERRGLERLAAAGLPVPERLRELVEADLCGLIFEYLPDVQPVRASDQEAMEIIAGYFGRLHAAGCWQSDPHLPNFVSSGGRLYAVDGDGVRGGSPFARRGGERANLALLAAQRPPELDAGLAGMLAAYGRERGGPPPSLQAFREAVRRARRARLARYLAKTLRSCSEFAVTRSSRRHTYLVRGPGEAALKALLAALPLTPGGGPAGAPCPGGIVLKAGNSATVVRLPPPARLVVKRYNIKGIRHGLRRMLRRHPRYRRSWMYGRLLAFLEIPTARPLALLEERRWAWRGVAYLAQEDLAGPDLAAEISGQGLSPARAREVAALFRRLKDCGLTHGDTKASNFIVHEGRVHLIDLDGMRLSRKGFRADVARFLDNWAPAERGRFEAAFRQAGLL